MSEIGTYYVSIVPSMKGAAKQIQADLKGIDTSSAGADMGKSLSKSMATSMNMKAVGDQITSLGDQISSVGSTLTKSITVPIAGAAIAAGGLVATLGWKRLVSVDTAQAQLRGLGYTAEDVDRISQDLTVALEGGMLTMGEATSAAAAGMAAGVDEGAELIRYIELLDAATAGSNGTFDEMNQIFARIQGSGQLMTNEMQMIEQRMPGFSGSAAEAFGVTQEEFRAMVSAGEISANDFLDIMDDFAGDMATEYAKSWEGMLQNTWAYIGILGEALLGGVFEQSKESIAEFIEYLSSEEVQAWAAEAGAAIGGAFVEIVAWVQDAINWWQNLDAETKNLILTIAGIAVAAGPVLKILGPIVSVVGKLVSAAGVLWGWLGKVAGGFSLTGGATGGFLKVLKTATGPIGWVIGALVAMWNHSEEFRGAIANLGEAVWEGAQRIWDALSPVLSKIGELFGSLTGDGPLGQFVNFIFDVLEPAFVFVVDAITVAFDTIVGVIEGALGIISGILDVFIALFTGEWELLGEGITSLVEGLWQVIVSIWEGGTEILVSALEALRDVITAIWDGISSVVTTAWSSVQDAISTGLSFISSLWSSVWGAISSFASSVWSTITSLISAAINGVRSTINSVMNTIQSIFSTIWSAILSLISSVLSSIASTVSSIWSSITSTISSFMSSISSTISSIWSSIVGAISGFLSSILSTVSLTWSNVVSTVSTAVGNVLSAVTSTFGEVVSFVAGIPGKLLSALGNLGSLFLDAGKALIGGLVDGIRGAFGSARDAVMGGLQGLRNMLPFSPAKEGPFSGRGYTLYSGEALIEDFGKGIAGASPEAIREMSKAAEAIAAETDISASIPDFLPTSWSSPSAPAVAMMSGGSGARSTSNQSLEASLVGAEIEIGPDGLARFVDGRVVIAMKDDKVTRVSRQSAQSQARRDAKAGAR